MEELKFRATRHKPQYVYLNQLNASSKSYIVRVVVAEKGRDILSSKKTVRFQTLLLKDEQGNRMRGTLFGDQIEAFEDALQYLGEYDISSAPIKFIDEKWRTDLDQFPYQMTFGSRTVIQPVDPELGPVLPNYHLIAAIPRAVDPDERYDVVGVVLYVEDEPRRVVGKDGGRDSLVREIIITDQSCDQPLSISLWNDLTEPRYFDRLKNWADPFQVIGFRALKPYTRRGFSMNSSMSTRIIYEPKGERARVLQDWVKLFHQRIVDRQAMVLDVKYPSENKKIVSIADLKRRKPSNTMQEEILWIEVTIQNADLDKVNAYTGCSNCSKRTNLPLQKRFTCPSCSNKESICSERATFKFEASDDTGSMAFTTFNDDTERLFRKTAAEIYAIKEESDYDTFRAIQNMLSSIPFYIQVGPTLHLAQNNVLEWALKSVQLKEDPNTQEITDETQGANETQVTNIMTEMQSSEPFIPTPNLKISSGKHPQLDPFTEELESPQQTSEMNKQAKSAGKRPMEAEAEQDTSQLQKSQSAARKKLCFGGMSPQKSNKSQGRTTSLGRGNAEDAVELTETDQKHTTPITVKTEKIKNASAEPATDGN